MPHGLLQCTFQGRGKDSGPGMVPGTSYLLRCTPSSTVSGSGSAVDSQLSRSHSSDILAKTWCLPTFPSSLPPMNGTDTSSAWSFHTRRHGSSGSGQTNRKQSTSTAAQHRQPSHPALSTDSATTLGDITDTVPAQDWKPRPREKSNFHMVPQP